MANEQVLRLGLDPRPAEAGAARFRRATGAASASAAGLASTVGVLGGAMVAFAGARQLGTAVRGMVEFDSAMTQSLAIMGDVSQMMRQDMARAAQEVGEELNFAAREGAEAFFFLASAGLDAEQSIAALPAVAEFARAGMFDFATATDLATDAQSALGLAAQDAEENLRSMTRVTDVLVKANTLANATVEQFSTALTSEAGAAIKTFGKDVEEGVAVLAAFADQGIKGQRAGSGLSRVMRLMSQAAVNNKAEMEALGIEFFDAEGNMRNMADVVENLTDVLGGMSDEQRAAALESIGFTARVQGIIQPLLGTSEAIREYEAGLREAGGTTKDVADNQMESLENRIGQIRREFEGWQRSVVERTVPAIEFLIDNIGTATDAARGLATVLAGLAALQLARPVLGWAGAFASLATQVRTTAGAVALLQAAIGPAGWLLAGLGAAAGLFTRVASETRKAQEATEAYERSLEAAGEKMQTLSEGETIASIQHLTERLDEARGRLFDMRQELDEHRVSSAGPGLDLDISGAQKEIEHYEQLLESAVERLRQLRSESAEGPEPPPDPTGDPTGTGPDLDALREQAGILRQMLDLELESDGLLKESLALQAELRDIAQDVTADAEDRIAAQQALNDLTESGLEHGQRLARAVDDAGDASEAFTDGFRRLPDHAKDTVTSMRDLGEEGVTAAQVFEDNWAAALSVVGAGVGGLTSQIANVAGAFATGGPFAGAAAAAGLFGSTIGDDSEQKRLAEETQRATDALTDFADSLRDTTRLQEQQEQALTRAQDAFEAAVEEYLAEEPTHFRDDMRETAHAFWDELGLEGLDLSEQIAVLKETLAEGVHESVRPIFEEHLRALELMEEARQREVAAMTEDLRVRELMAQGRDDDAEAMRREIARREELDAAIALGDDALVAYVESVHAQEEAARRAAEAEEALHRSRMLNFDLAGREAALAGDDRGAAIARAKARAEQDIREAEEMLDAGEITREQFDRIMRVIEGEFIGTIEDYDDAQRDAADASREAAEAMRDTANALNAPQGFRLSLLRWQASAFGVGMDPDRDGGSTRPSPSSSPDGPSARDAFEDFIQNREESTEDLIESIDPLAEGNRRLLEEGFWPLIDELQILRGAGDRPPPNADHPSVSRGEGIGATSQTTNNRVTNTFNVTIQAAPGQNGRDLWRQFKREAEREARAGNPDVFLLRE